MTLVPEQLARQYRRTGNRFLACSKLGCGDLLARSLLDATPDVCLGRSWLVRPTTLGQSKIKAYCAAHTCLARLSQMQLKL